LANAIIAVIPTAGTNLIKRCESHESGARFVCDLFARNCP
jgi:hypothetical protein